MLLMLAMGCANVPELVGFNSKYMAAIDKMYLKDYYVFDEFRLWCLIHNPKLLRHFYYWNMIYKEWEHLKEEIYQSHKEMYDKELKSAPTVEVLRARYKKFGYDPPIEQLEKEIANILTQVEKLKDKPTYIRNITLPITNFSCKEDEYLLWHCPIEEVREYLTKQCGYKERWYYKLFFKY